MLRSSDSFVDRATESIRKSIRLASKKVRDKTHTSTIPQSSFEENDEEEEKKEEEEEAAVCQEMEEAYTLPDIPHTPLSVMQINKLIETGLLEEAHLNLLALRHEFQQDSNQYSKEKDLSLLYSELRSKICTIVRDSGKELSGSVARIIQEEEKRAEQPGGLQGSWMEAWREAVAEGVQEKVKRVALEQKEQSSSWLAVHLALLGKAIVEDLQNVKGVLRAYYPPSFKVFSTYVNSYHRVVGQHLKTLEQQVTELKDLYVVLDWIINKYKSEKIMGSVSLQPDIKDESTDLQLEENFLKQLKEKYCCKVKEDLSSSLDRVIELENEDYWQKSQPPRKEDGFLDSHFHMDIWTKVESAVKNTQKIDPQLDQKVSSSCLEELKQFPVRFESEFKRHCGALEPQPLWVDYHITYINSFTALQEHMKSYCDACPEEVKGFSKEVEDLVGRLTQVLENQFKEDVKPYLRRMMTRKWLNNDSDFTELHSRTKLLSQHCAVMRPPCVQRFADRLYLHMAKEYFGQLMKNNYSCKNRKHEKAAAKIRQQWGELGEQFEDMKSTHEWLDPVGDDLSKIIGQKNKADIKQCLEPLVKNYPDFGKKHLIAVLNFRGLFRGREHQLILQRFTELKKNVNSESMDRSRVLFKDMQVNVNTDCLSSLPFSCFRVLLPESSN
ncbi:exocyst complex component 3-like protein 4 isoform X2 [Anabas testudineus]|nr:exocyst complex component 3-like protein 4 isoform X2 [Anabas testudineus]